VEVGHRKLGTDRHRSRKEKKWKRREALSIWTTFMWPRACEGALRLFSRDMHCRRGAVSTAPDQATSVQNGRTPQLAATEREKHTTRAYSNDSPHMTAAVRLQTLPSGPRHPLL
jgi:predicted metal-dependent hydrolase